MKKSIESIDKKNNSFKSTKSKAKLNRIQMYILYFFIFALLGWCMESLYAIYNLGHFVKRGFLYGPICPIYGWGALMLIIFFSKYRKSNIKLFIYAGIIFSVFEYFVSYGLDAIFQMHWWDYTNDFFNLNGRISIFYSFAWGIIAILFVNHIFPFFKKKVNVLLAKIPYKAQITTLYIFIITFLADTTISFIRYL